MQMTLLHGWPVLYLASPLLMELRLFLCFYEYPRTYSISHRRAYL